MAKNKTILFGGFMELKAWSKTLLNIYGCLFRLTREIDKIVVSFAINSGYFNGMVKTYNDIQKVIELTDRKVTIINLKLLIDKCLNNLDATSTKILTLKYIDRISNETIYQVLNMKRRTFYRRYLQAISAFANQLYLNGFNNTTAQNFIKDETWIMEVYHNCLDKEMNKNPEQEFSKYSIYNLAFNNFKKIKKVDYSCIF